ncbi:hypothetical protein EUGRSUZ_J00007 [Eucalyptus grandis]|uniref:Uncharacterized protein n=2 Tax=Eucalyptus grandis TaxID=71139 RepID=A0ACC3J0D5_EUCGR|nr:hypothetical protein EUGRSUZ_J00007 [Eucalyptus grandis]
MSRLIVTETAYKVRNRYYVAQMQNFQIPSRNTVRYRVVCNSHMGAHGKRVSILYVNKGILSVHRGPSLYKSVNLSDAKVQETKPSINRLLRLC